MPEALTGGWIHEKQYGWYRCGKCKKVYRELMLLEYFDVYQYMPRFLYCPNCGSYNGGISHDSNTRP